MKGNTDTPRAYVLIKSRAYPPTARRSEITDGKHCKYAKLPIQPTTRQEFYWVPVMSDRSAASAAD